MSSLANVLREKYEYGHNPILEFNCPVVVKDNIINEQVEGSDSREWITATIVREAAESIDLVSRFEESVKYIDFFPQVFYASKMITLALRIHFVVRPNKSLVEIDFSSAMEEGTCFLGKKKN